MNVVRDSLPIQAIRAEAWRTPLAVLSLALLILTVLFAGSFASMEAIWRRSGTYTLGYAVPPISLWLMWRSRRRLNGLTPVADARALVAIAACGLVWIVARAVSVGVVEQLATVALIPALVLATLGAAVTRALRFPLAYLFLMVPIGEALTVPLMDLTADFTVAAVRLFGIPVYREGNFFVLPTGSWSVVEACSGLRYLVAAFTLGTLYAYLTYHNPVRRLLFMAAAIVVPVIANGLRALLIVMIGHLSGMTLAAGVDHLIYGWVFFGVVMAILIGIAGRWRETDEGGEARVAAAPAAMRSPWPIWLASLLLLVAFPAWARILLQDVEPTVAVLDLSVPDWQPSAAFSDWQPHYAGMDASLHRHFRRHDQPVGIHLLYYAMPREGAELVTSTNVLVEQKHSRWRQVCRRGAAWRDIRPIEGCLQSSGQRLLVWYWYWVDGRSTSNPYFAKLIEAGNRLLGRASPSAAILLYTVQADDEAAARARLSGFLNEAHEAIERALTRARGDA